MPRLARHLLCTPSMGAPKLQSNDRMSLFPMGKRETWFDSGNYCGVAQGTDEQAGAAMGLVGNFNKASALLSQEDSRESRFYLAAAHWIHGDEDEARFLLNQSGLDVAKRLLAILDKPKITVAAQSVWEIDQFVDDRFQIEQVGLRRTMLNDQKQWVPDCRPVSKPCLSARDCLQTKPDFYFAHMIEWQFLPYDLPQLDCPTFGITSDMDIHIQNVLPWLPAFDTVVTLGSEEWSKVRSLRDGPVCTFPKLFGINPDHYPVDSSPTPRDVDVFISGTLNNHYHPDKAPFLQSLLDDPSINIRSMDGFLAAMSYVNELTRSKISYTYVRHPGSMPSRGVESLAAGCAILTQPESALRLFANESEGVFTYSPNQLTERIRELLDNWNRIAPAASRGSALMKTEFTQSRCISQFLRFLTVQTALLGSEKPRKPIDKPHQRRFVVRNGWDYPPTVNRCLMENAWTELAARESVQSSPENAILAAREVDLFLSGDISIIKSLPKSSSSEKQMDTWASQLKQNASDMYHEGIAKFPKALVLKFNGIRHALHEGNSDQIPHTLDLIEKILSQPFDSWSVPAEHDVMPWDYHGAFFNYRTYFDSLVSGKASGHLAEPRLVRLILAALAHYRALYTGEIAWLEKAVEWDPEFARYRYSLARGLLLRNKARDVHQAAELLEKLFFESGLVVPAFELLAKIHHNGYPIKRWDEIEHRFHTLKRITAGASSGQGQLANRSLVLPPSSSGLALDEDPFTPNVVTTGIDTAAHLAIPTGRVQNNPKNVLLIPFECGNWKNARAWSYNGFYAFEDALRAQGINTVTLPAIAGVPTNHQSSWIHHAQALTDGQQFDQVWIWITHNDYDSEFFKWLNHIAPIRVGVVMESLEHTQLEINTSSILRNRRSRVVNQLKHCSHVLTFDDQDASVLPDILNIKALWCPPVANWRDIVRETKLTPSSTVNFQGTIYSEERARLIKHPLLNGIIEHPEPLENKGPLPSRFDTLQKLSIEQLLKTNPITTVHLDDYLSELRRIRRRLNDLWMQSLANSFAQVNLPSIFKSYAGRVVESMAAGRPVISWKPPRERTQALFKPGEEILWFDRDDPEALARQIRFLQKHPEQAQAIAERARQKVLRYHTAETRVRQILDWIADGTLPDYGEHTDLSTETHQPQTDMNEPSHPQIDTLEAALEHAEACNDRDDRPGAIQALERAVELGDHHPVLLRALGTQQYLAGNHGAATELFREFTENCPNDATGHVQFALATYHAGDELGCEVALQQALLLEANHPEALKLSADLDVRHKRYDKAREKYDLIAETGGITVDALHALAFCQFKTGETDRAENTYQQLLAFNSDDELAQANLKTIAKLQQPEAGQPETGPAETNLEQADFFQQAGNPEAALAELEQAVNRDQHNAGLREALGSLLYQQDRTEEARRQFRRLIELQPQCAMAYTRLAMTSYATERFDEFESALGLAMELDPELPEMLHFFGKVNLDQGRYYEAGRVFSKLVELEPDHPDNLLALGVCLYHGNQPEAAQQTFERVLQLDPTNPLAQENLTALANNDSEALTAIAEQSAPPTETSNVTVEEEEPLSHRTLKSAQTALEQGDPQRAIDLLQDVLIEHPHEVPILNALANLLQQAGLNVEAARHFQQLALLEPENIAPRLQAATAALLGGEIDVFEINMEKALELDAQNPHGLKLLATANFKAGKYREAADIYHQALPGLPEDIEIVVALGVCFHHLQSPDTARDCFKRALEIDPQNELAAENLKALSSEADEKSGTNSHVSAKVLRELREANPSTESNSDSNPELPPVALMGNLDRAQALLAEGRHVESWQETLQTMELRPFHPEAYLHLAEVALDAGDYAQAMICLGRLTTLTPEWEVPRQALDTLRQGSVPENSATMDWPALPEVPETPRLTVCMIVKNEEQFIAQALQSVQPHADQIVVVDTGSTDQTVAIAEQYGAETHHFEWCDDFAAARNAALEHARGDWVLVLDADEIVPTDEAHHLHTDLAQPNMLGYRLPLYNKILNADGTDETADGQCHVPRLFRNAPSVHFVGRVHEQVYSSVLARQLDWQMDSAIGHTTLHHFGYTPEIKDKQDKVKRNLRLLEKAVAEEPAEPTLLMNYALDLFNDGQFEAALEKDRQAFSLLSEKASANVLPEIRERLVSVFCYHLLQAELYEELAEVAASPLSRDCGPTASIHYVHGLALLKLGRPAEAIAPFRDCILKREEPVYTARFKGVENHGPHHLLADCYAQTGRTEEARSEYEEALKLSPEATIVRWGYARFLTEQDLSDEAIQLLFGAIENGSIDSRLWALGCHIVNGHLNDTEVAQRWTECAIDADPRDAEIRKQRGIALLTVGRFQEAEEFFAKTPLHPLNEGARILCQVATGQTPHLSDPDKEILISTAFMEWFRRLVERGQEPAARAVAEQHSQLEDALPTAAEMLRSMMVADG